MSGDFVKIKTKVSKNKIFSHQEIRGIHRRFVHFLHWRVVGVSIVAAAAAGVVVEVEGGPGVVRFVVRESREGIDVFVRVLERTGKSVILGVTLTLRGTGVSSVAQVVAQVAVGLKGVVINC